MSRPLASARVWNVMRLSGRAPIDVIAAQAGVSRGVCADLIRCWEDAGLARITRSNK